MFRARHTPAPLTQLRAQPGALRPRLCKGGPAPEPQLYTREPAPLDPGKAESPQSAAARLWGLGRSPDPHRRVPRVPGVPGPRPAKPPAAAPARERPPNVAAQAELHSSEERRAREGGERLARHQTGDRALPRQRGRGRAQDKRDEERERADQGLGQGRPVLVIDSAGPAGPGRGARPGGSPTRTRNEHCTS